MGSLPDPLSAKITIDPPLPPTFWPFRIVDTESGRRVIIDRNLFIIWATSLALTLWLSAATAGYLFNKYRADNPEVRFTHMLLYPIKAKAYRAERSAYWLRVGLQLFGENKWRDAFDLLRMGLPEHPDNLDARFALARIYLAAQRPELASDVLIDGLTHHGEQLDYVRTVFGLLFAQQADATAVELGKKLMARFPAGHQIRSLALGARMIGLYNRDRFQDVRTLLRAEGVEQSPEAKIVFARIAWDQNRSAEAIAALYAVLDAAPDNAEAYKTLADYLQASKAYPELRRLAIARRLRLPDEWSADIHLMEVASATKETAEQETLERDYLDHFRSQPAALLALGEYAARQGRHTLTQTLVNSGLLTGENLPTSWLHHVLALLEAREFTAAVDAIANPPARASWLPPQEFHLACLRTVARAGIGQTTEADVEIGALLQSRFLTAQSAYLTAKRLLDIGRSASARRLLERAVDLDPLHQPSVEQLLRLELETKPVAEVIPLVRRLLAVRKPSLALIHRVRDELESDRWVYVSERGPLLKELQPGERTR